MNDNLDKLIFYSNRIELEGSGFDLKFTFRISDNGQNNELAQVYISWPHAKKLLEIIKGKIDEYESLYSEIITEPNQEALERLMQEKKIAQKVVD